MGPNLLTTPVLLPLTVGLTSTLTDVFTDVFIVFKWSLNVSKTKQGDLDDARKITAVCTFIDNQVEQLFKILKRIC